MQDKYKSIIKAINEMSEEINNVLNNNIKGRYLEMIFLLYSFIENILKFLSYLKITWEKTTSDLEREEETSVRRKEEFLKLLKIFRNPNFGFSPALEIALTVDLIDYDLYEKISEIRSKRNKMVHNLWLYSHRKDFSDLREKLEELTKVANPLVGKFNELTKEIGLERK